MRVNIVTREERLKMLTSDACAVLERYHERLSVRQVETIVGNVAVIPCTAVSRSVPNTAHTQFEFNSARLRITSESRDLLSLLNSGNQS